MSELYTVFDETHNEIIINKSKFISHIKPITIEQDALDYISEIKTKYWDATHNVYAYIIEEPKIERYSDDGEPKGTAGIPTLQTIKDRNLTNIVVVTTRYFGGIMLGAGGLVRAYRKSVLDGLDVSKIITKRESVKVKINLEYSYLSILQNLAPTLGIIIANIVYEDNVKLDIILLDCELENFRHALMNILSRDVNINKVEKTIIALDEKGQLIENQIF